MVIDLIIIIISLVLVILDINISGKQFSSVAKVFRGIFRLFRLFLLFRKVNFIKSLEFSQLFIV